MKAYRNRKNKVVGELKDGIFRKRVKLSKHLLKMMDAWGIDKAIIDNLEMQRCKEIRILDEEYDVVYSIPFLDFKYRGIPKDFGEDAQLFVPREHFKITQHEIHTIR